MENDNTDDNVLSMDENSVGELVDNQSASDESKDDSSQNENVLSSQQAEEGDELKESNDENILNDDEVGDFSELSNLIHSRNVIDLTKDYKNIDNHLDSKYGAIYVNEYGFTKTIDGHGHTIDFNQYGSFTFMAQRGSTGYVTFKNIIFKNGRGGIMSFGGNPEDGAIHLKVINCSFENDEGFVATGKGAAISYNNILGGTVYIKDTNFTNNAGINGIPFASSSRANYTFDNCIFRNNYIDRPHDNTYRGGLLTFFGSTPSLNFYNCKFENNTLVGKTYSGDDLHCGGIIFLTASVYPVELNIINTTFKDSRNINGNGAALYIGPTPGSGTIKTFKFDVNINNSSFINCNADRYGGAIYITGYNGLSNGPNANVYYYFKMNIENGCSFINCSSKNGGALFFDAPWITGKTTCDVDLNIHDNVLFENNRVNTGAWNSGGGAIYVGYTQASTVSPQNIETYTIDVNLSNNVSFVGNSAVLDALRNCGGGAIYVFSHANLAIDNCSFSDNSLQFRENYVFQQQGGGGAIFVGKPNDQNEELISTLSINNTSFNNNTVGGSKGSGGAIFVKDVSSNNITDTVFDGNGVNANSGSAIYFDGESNNRLDNVTFSNNVASGKAVGGALSFGENTNNVISDCNFINNSITSNNGNGGAVYYKDGAGQGENTYVNTTFEGNSATNGGAVYIGTGWENIEFIESNFTNNSAYTGGALYLYNSSAIVNNSNFNENKVNKSGGAVYTNQATMNINNSNFEGNNANKSGGALYAYENSKVNIDNSNFENNSATNLYGGAIFAGVNSETSIDHSNFANNSAFEGSAINYQAETGVENSHSLSNSRFFDNLADSIYLDVALDKETNRLEIVYSGGDNYINAIKSYDDMDFDNVSYYAYGQGIKNTDEGDVVKSYLIPYQYIHVDYLDENGNVISSEVLVTDENGKAVTTVPLDAVSLRVYREGDAYYTPVSTDMDCRLGDFDILQRKIHATAENQVLVLDRDYTYTIELDRITEGIEVDRPITIDGRGHSIDALFKSRVFNVLVDNVTFINIVFLNSTNWDGSFIYGYNVSDIEIENCTFKNPLDFERVLHPEEKVLDEDDDRITIPPHIFDGGAVYVVGNDTFTNNSRFINLIAYHGGAVYLNGTNHTIVNSYFNYTYAINAGGGVFAIGNDFAIDNSEFENCFADVNGTGNFDNLDEYILNRNQVIVPGVSSGRSLPGDFTLGNGKTGGELEVLQNTVTRQGGGAVYFEGENISITNSNFTNCTTNSFGGAVYSNGLNTDISNSNFTSSKALTGGAVFMDIDAAMSSIDASIFFNNTATANGGAVSWYGEDGLISNSRFMNNTQRANHTNVTNGGGAVYWFGHRGQIAKSNFTYNRVAFPFDNPNYSLEDHYEWTYYGLELIKADLNKYLNFNMEDENLLAELFRTYSKGGALLIRGEDIHVQECAFEENYAQSGGAISVQDSNFVIIENSTFTDNFAQYGGAAYVECEQGFMGQNAFAGCEFYNNTAYQAGAIFLAVDNWAVEESVFKDNAAFIGGAISNGCQAERTEYYLYPWGEQVPVTMVVTVGNNNQIFNSTFENNIANTGGAIFWFGENGMVEKCHFIENKYADSFGRYAEGLKDCYCMNINASDYYAIKNHEISGEDHNTGESSSVRLIQGMPSEIFEGCGGAIYWMGFMGLISDSEFVQNSAFSGGAIFAVDLMGQSDENNRLITIGGCNFTDNTAKDGGAVSAIATTAGIYESNFVNNTASQAQPASEHSSVMPFTDGNYGGAIFWMGNAYEVNTCNFTGNKADMGGAVSVIEYWEGDNLIFASENGKIFNSFFDNNSAVKGGAIYNEGAGLSLSAAFINNTAEKGGAIYNKANGLSMRNSGFLSNKADMGSAVFDESKRMEIIDSGFLENKASAASLVITSSDVDGKIVSVSAKFKGNDNMINALYVLSKPYFENVIYWGAEGMTNTDEHDPAISDPEAGQNITFELINSEDSSIIYTVVNVTNWYGEAVATVRDVKSGRYYAVVSHYDDNYYTEINALKIINVGKVESPISVDADDIFYGENATVNITLNRDVTGNLTVQIDGKNFTSIDLTDKNGFVSLNNISGLQAGIHNVTVFYSGDDNYDASSKTVKFTVKQISSTLIVESDGGAYKQNITVNVTVPGDAAGKVILTIENEFGATLTINDTNELQAIVNNLNAGEYNITAYYVGDVNHLPVSNYTTFTVSPIDLNPEVAAANVTVTENTTFTITVPDDFVGQVRISVDNITKVYDIAGSTQITFVGLAPGNKTANVTFYGNRNYNNATVYPVNFTVSEIPENDEVHTISVEIPDTTYPNSTQATVNVSGNLNGTAVIFIDDKNFTVTITNGTGTCDIAGLSAGVKTAVVNFTSEDKKVNLTAVYKFAVDKAQSKIDVKTEGSDVIVNVTAGATGNVTFYVNGVKQVIELNGSAARLKNVLAVGNNTIVVVYEGDKNYTESENDTWTCLDKIKSQVNVTASDVRYGEDAVITVTVPVNQTGYVTITLNSTNYTRELENGQAVFSIMGLDVGEYEVTAVYLGNDKYESEKNFTKFNVTKADLNIKVIGLNVTVNDNTSFIITNVPEDFKGKVNITFEEDSYSGDAYAMIVMNRHTAGNKTATAVFYGDKNYNDLEVKVNFTVSGVSQNATVISIAVSDVTYPANAIANITVSGNANGTVTVIVDGNALPQQIVENGFARVDLGVLSAGVKDITAIFNVTDDVNTNATANTKFTVKKASSQVNITVDGKNVIATVNDGATGNVTFYVNGEKQVIPVENSQAVWIDALEIGNNTIVVVYEGNENYTESENNTNKYLDKLEAYVNVTAKDTVYGSDAIISVEVPINQTGYVSITIADVTYTQELKGGKAVFNVPGLKVGEHEVSVTYLGNDKYGIRNNATAFNVTKAELQATVVGENVTVLQNATFIIGNVPDDFTGRVNITVDGETYPCDVDSIVHIPKLTSGNKTATVTFYGDKNYDVLTLKVNFTVSLIPTAVSVEIPDVTYPGDTEATITVSGNANGSAVVRIDGKEYTTVNIVNGHAKVNLTGLSGGIHEAIVDFTSADGINSDASATTKFEVRKAQSQVSIIVEGKNVTAKVTPNATGNVTFYINGHKQVVPVENSQAVWIDALEIGNNTIVVVYEGNENYTVSENSTYAFIEKLESYVNVTAQSVVYGSDAVISVKVPANQTGYVTISVGGKNYTQELKDGEAVFTVPGLAVDEYEVSVKYLGDDKYNVSTNATKFNVTKADLNAAVIGENVTVIQNSEFIISVPDDFTGKVNITVDGKTYSGDAKSLIKMDKLTAGDKTATVVFWNDPNYNDLTLTARFTVSELPISVNMSTVNADNMTRGFNSPFDYQAAFLDSEGNALKNITVEFRVNGQTYNATTNEDGIAHLTQSKLDIGVYNITSVNTQTGEEMTCELRIVARIIENRDLTMDFRDGSSFIVKVIGDDGNVAPEGEIISIMANGIRYVAKVDAKGFAKLKINLNPKKYTVVCEYKTYNTTNKLVVKQTLKLVKKTVSVKKGKKLVLKAQLKWSNGKAIKGKKIVFKFKGKKYTAKTNSKGIAKVTIKGKVTKKLKKGKTYGYRASYYTNTLKGKVKIK